MYQDAFGLVINKSAECMFFCFNKLWTVSVKIAILNNYTSSSQSGSRPNNIGLV